VSAQLREVTRGAAAARGRAGAVCLLPVGSLEQHGEHLPVGTDSLLVEVVVSPSRSSHWR
jgi:creatinine amidohydrolase